MYKIIMYVHVQLLEAKADLTGQAWNSEARPNNKYQNVYTCMYMTV